ncbi:MAG: site-specific integrase, partial [Bacteroidetes bacterium]|nr:site-specific integrase [Bacteroidota bacterium]
MFLEQYLKYLQYEKRYSQHTLIAYKKDLSQYYQFLKSSENEILTANHHTIRSWMVNLMDENIDARSINRKISALRSFYKFLIKENFLTENPVIKVQTPKVAKKLPTFIPDEKLNSLLDSENSFSDDFSGLRDKMVIELLFGTGIRLSELLNLTINSVKAQERTIKVLGKRNKERIVPVNQSLFSLIENYNLEKNKQEFSNNSNLLIVTNTGARSEEH